MWTVTVLVCYAIGCIGASNDPPIKYKTEEACIKRGKEIVTAIKRLPMVAGMELISQKITCTPKEGSGIRA